MGRPLRHQSPDTLYFITNRCAQGEFLMRPDKECNRIITGCVARAAKKHNVQLVCFGFYPNHFHLIAGFPTLSRNRFMEDMTGQISDRLNTHRDRSGSMFPVRYHAQVLCDDQSIRDKICYVLNNPVKDGLVARAEAWPGVNSINCHKTGNSFEGRWLNHKKWTKLSRRKTSDHERCEAMENYSVDLHLPDALDGDNDKERRESLLELIDDDRRRLRNEAEEELGCPPSYMGANKIRTQDPRARPIDSDIDKPGRSRRRLFISTAPGGASARMEKHRERTAEYRAAVEALYDGDPAQFPEGMHPPGTCQCVGQQQAWENYQASSDG